jgi:hypothetical protein
LPGIIYTKQIFNDQFSNQIIFKPAKNTSIPVENYADFEIEFISGLTACVEEIFDPEVPFVQTNSIDACSYCNFKNICNR